MARNTLVINCDIRETRVALIEGGVIAELHIERAANRGTVGNIVLGKVTRVLPGMQAAFIDVGMERAAFLHVEDLIRPKDFEAYLHGNARDPDEPSMRGEGGRRRNWRLEPDEDDDDDSVEVEVETAASSDDDDPAEDEAEAEASEPEASEPEASEAAEKEAAAKAEASDASDRRRGIRRRRGRGRARDADAEEKDAKEPAESANEAAEAVEAAEAAPEDAIDGDWDAAPASDAAGEEPSDEAAAEPSAEAADEASDEDEASDADEASDEGDAAPEADAEPIESREHAAPPDSESDRKGRRRRRRRRGGKKDEAPEKVEAKSRKDARGNGRKDQRGKQATSRVSRSVPITEVVKEGDQVIVQISKEPIGTKGARVTSHISLPGRYVVYLPTVDHVGISKRIGSARERQRLRAVMEALKPPVGGLIVRTVAEGLTKGALKADVGYLMKLWAEVARKKEGARAPCVLSSELDLVLKTARDLFTDDIQKIVIDDKEQYARLVRFVEMFLPERVKDIELYTGAEPIYDAYGIEDEIGRGIL